MQKKGQSISTYNVRIQRSSYHLIDRAIEGGQLKPTRELRSGAGRGQLWCPASWNNQAALDDRTFLLGQMTIQSNVYRLPGEAFGALVIGSHGQFKRAAKIDNLVTVLTAGNLGGSGPKPPALPAATWVPTETRLIEQGRDWLLSLAFSSFSKGAQGMGGVAAGVDIGLSPLATTVLGNRFIHTPAVSDAGNLRQDTTLRDAIEIADYLAARQALDNLTRVLVAGASLVAVERLDLSGFRGGFVAQGREAAILDWHQAWLPQDLRAAGIPLVRVEPAYTSRQCHRCNSHETSRQRDKLHCRSCDWQGNVHENAALNIRSRGQLHRAS